MKYLIHLLCFYIFFVGHHLSAQQYLPTNVPDRVILSWETSPAISQAISWRTDTSVSEGWVELGFAKGSPDFRLITAKLQVEQEVYDYDGVNAHYFSVNLENLLPETHYAYRVGNPNGWSEWFHFKTASIDQKPFSFIYFGDAQNEIRSMWSRAIREAILTAPKANFMLHAGDLVNRWDRDSEWGEWFYAGGWINGMIPSIATPGNHEYGRAKGETRRQLSPQWKPTFAFPQNGPEGLEETVYYIDYQGTRFISINSMAMFVDTMNIEKEKLWLEEVLKRNPNDWTIITHHHPIYSAGKGRDTERFRNEFKPLYEKYGVDLVLQGHDHTYARGGNMLEGIQAKNITGPVYVVSVSGPKMYESALSEWMDRVAMNTQLFQVIEVKKDELNYAAYTVTGELYDAFQLQKSSVGTNVFIDQRPKEAAERLDLPQRVIDRMTPEAKAEFHERFKAFKEKMSKN